MEEIKFVNQQDVKEDEVSKSKEVKETKKTKKQSILKKKGNDKVSAFEFQNYDKTDLSSVIEQAQGYMDTGVNTEWVDTGSIVLNEVFGGGYPSGRIVELYSEEGLGKSTIALDICKSFCDHGYSTVYLDIEHALSDEIIEGVGLKEYEGNQFAVFRPITFSDVEELLFGLKSKKALLNVDNLKLIVIDSATSIESEKELSESCEKAVIGNQARIMTLFMKKLRHVLRSSEIGCIMISQTRTKINLIGPSGKVSASCSAVKFWADIRLKMKYLKDITDNTGGEKKILGAELLVEAEKNKFTAPYAPQSLYVLFGKGISNLLTYKQRLIETGGAIASGPVFKISIGDIQKNVMGNKGLEDFIKENQSLVEEFLSNKGMLKTEPEQ